MTEPVAISEIHDQEAALRAEVRRIERIGLGDTPGRPLQPHEVALLALICDAADLLERLVAERGA